MKNKLIMLGLLVPSVVLAIFLYKSQAQVTQLKLENEQLRTTIAKKENEVDNLYDSYIMSLGDNDETVRDVLVTAREYDTETYWHLYKDFYDTSCELSDEDFDLLCSVVQAECGDEYSFDCKANVATVIFNRLGDPRFEDTMAKLLSSDQFESVSNKRYKKVEVSEQTKEAVLYAYEFRGTIHDALFFDSNHKLKYQEVFTDGAHTFYTTKEDI